MLVGVADSGEAEAAVTIRSLRLLRDRPSDGDGIGDAVLLVLGLRSAYEVQAVLALKGCVSSGESITAWQPRTR